MKKQNPFQPSPSDCLGSPVPYDFHATHIRRNVQVIVEDNSHGTVHVATWLQCGVEIDSKNKNMGKMQRDLQEFNPKDPEPSRSKRIEGSNPIRNE